ncbi:MAG TPA: HAMP domain-containing sensor histidine kinase [Marmoricola sp.]|nr:HAMP domain-containing sensor histidine kinase [Marmoricola sp.]
MLSLRGRLMTIGLLGVAVALAVGGVVLYGVLRVTGMHTLDRSAAATAHDVVALVRSNRLPDPIPVTGAQIVQVVDGRGRVVSASQNADRLTALLLPREVREARRSPIEVSGSRNGLAARLRVTATRAPHGEVVLVAQQVDQIERSAHTLARALLVTFPVLLLVLAVIAWRVIGATLRPVEALRAGAERISGSGRDERLPDPGTDDEVGALARTLNSMLERLAGSRERQRAFLADVAHELRSPLASMRTQLEVAQQLGEGGELVDGLHEETVRMGTLVEDLLVLARLDADTAPPSESVPVEVGAAFAAACGRYADARLVVHPAEPRDLRVLGDHDELVRILTNLVDNALRHATGRVTVAAERRGARVALLVDDDGPGVPEEHRETVLQRFTRLDESRDRDAGGSGLGLAIVGELVTRRGGRVVLGDSPLGGLRVEVLLPVA